MPERWSTPSTPSISTTTTTAPTPSPSTGAAQWRPASFVAPGPLRVAAFNRLTRAEAITVLQPCFAVERWWTAVVDARPYADHESLLAAARRAADPLTQRELDLALTVYLGMRPDDWLPSSDTTLRTHASSVAVLHDRITEDSRAYLARFGRPFVIRTAGRSTSEVAAHLRRRVGADPATEDRTSAAALRQIGLLALVRRIPS